MYSLAKNILFALDPEVSHEFSLDMLGAAHRLKLLEMLGSPRVEAPVEVMGLRFPNAVGLAAGLDKNGDYFNALGTLGFGFVEIGTITPKPQLGNPKPRLFRLKDERAIINRMGFNNKGVEHLVAKAANKQFDGILGINIGKNKVTPEENALDDYQACMTEVYPYADYITVNISSPNTPGLRNLQFGDAFEQLLNGIKRKQTELAEQHEKNVPVAVKIAPDMSEEELDEVADCLLSHKVDAVIATNTTIGREGVEWSEYKDQAGGLSGVPVRDKSTATIAHLASRFKGDIPIIGVGGIMSGADAEEKIAAGASLVQIYSGFIYEGPKLIADAAEAIARMR